MVTTARGTEVLTIKLFQDRKVRRKQPEAGTGAVCKSDNSNCRNEHSMVMAAGDLLAVSSPPIPHIALMAALHAQLATGTSASSGSHWKAGLHVANSLPCSIRGARRLLQRLYSDRLFTVEHRHSTSSLVSPLELALYLGSAYILLSASGPTFLALTVPRHQARKLPKDILHHLIGLLERRND